MIGDTILQYKWDRYFKNEGIKLEVHSFERYNLELHYIPKLSLEKKLDFNEIMEEDMFEGEDFFKGFTYKINTKPKCRYHILLESNKKQITKASINKLIEISDFTGTAFSFNSDKEQLLSKSLDGIIGGVPAMENDIRIIYFQDDEIKFGNSIYSKNGLPWRHLVFKGKKASKFYLEALETIKAPYFTTIIQGNEIQIIPKKEKKISNIQFCGIQRFTSEKQYKKAKKNPKYIINMRKKVAFVKDKKILKNFLKSLPKYKKNYPFFKESS